MKIEKAMRDGWDGKGGIKQTGNEKTGNEKTTTVPFHFDNKRGPSMVFKPLG